ncbi:hypothetical protein J1605_004601 [Eschrichtius robustus]|uniref:GDP-mannose 4,6-dehydratase n=1 Tax=Eschrichtius robustus TaxID=9764 RepID=A0AB34HEW9_ESCRO|nr:hypothetical protein J1605_004601 [Eschrichtius robustus]
MGNERRSISFDLAEYTADVDGVGTLRLLDAVKTCGLINSVKFYQASTSELYGKVQEIPQKETTPFYPRSPYGAAKLYAYWIVVNFREAYNLFAVNGILFNHESPRRAGPPRVGRRRPRGLSASGFAEPGLGRGSLATGLRQPSVLFCVDDDVCLTGVSRGPISEQIRGKRDPERAGHPAAAAVTPPEESSLNWDLCVCGNLGLETAKLPLTFSKTKTVASPPPGLPAASAPPLSPFPSLPLPPPPRPLYVQSKLHPGQEGILQPSAECRVPSQGQPWSEDALLVGPEYLQLNAVAFGRAWRQARCRSSDLRGLRRQP